MTACPCAMETVRDDILKEHPEMTKWPEGFPIITHNQRNRTTVILQEPSNHEVEADELIDIVEDSLSAPTFGLLKRPDEGRLVEMAHRNPKFVEDVVRDVLERLLKRYPKMPDGTWVRVKSEADESDPIRAEHVGLRVVGIRLRLTHHPNRGRVSVRLDARRIAHAFRLFDRRLRKVFVDLDLVGGLDDLRLEVCAGGHLLDRDAPLLRRRLLLILRLLLDGDLLVRLGREQRRVDGNVGDE